MTHFGITALGPPNNFQSALTSALGCNVFSVEEFEHTFKRYDKEGSGCIATSDVEDLLHDTYGFPPLEDEVTMFTDKIEGDQVSWEQFKQILEDMKAQTGGKAANAKEYKSWELMRQHRYKHIRMNGELQDKYKVPMTSSQSYGYYSKDQQQAEISKMVSFPIHHCPETKYADEMTKTGFLFN